ncbi:MAG: SGNH/GDSL hydrolase family protein [Lachnospira sp.]|nr:SGNH/GDSL hydrolase family protein [Lachnospira sp.]
MEQGNQKKTKGQGTRGIYIFLMTAIIILLFVLVYLLGIIFSRSFAKWTLTVPGISGISKILVGNLYQEDDSVMEEIKHKQNPVEHSTTQSVKNEEVETVLPLSGEKSETYLNHCIFLGDSRTVAMANYGYVAEDSTLAEVGLAHVNAINHTYTYSTGLQYTMSTYLETHKADVIYISFGVNGISFTEEEQYKDKYEELVDYVMDAAPDSKIVIQGIWPIKEGYPMTQKFTNANIDYYNDYLLELAKEKGIYYLDSNKVLKDDYNSMDDAYNSGDGLHYNEAGYARVMSYLLSHAVPGVLAGEE